MTKQLGLNLLELMVVIAVATILAVIAVPSYQRLIASTRVNAQTTELVSVLLYLRTEALKRNISVSICPSAAPADVSPVCTPGSAWASGWIVFTDGGTPGTVDGTDVVLRVGQPAAGIILELPANYSSWLGFSPTGLPRVLTGGGGNGTIFVCSPVGDRNLRRSISISLAGRIVRNDFVSDSAQCNAP